MSGQPLNSLIANRPQRRTNREASHSRKQNKSSNFIFALFPTKCGTASSESNSGLLWLGRKEALVTVSGPDGKLPAPAIIVSCGVTAPGHPGAGIDSLAEFRRLPTIRNTPFGLLTGGRAVAIGAPRSRSVSKPQEQSASHRDAALQDYLRQACIAGAVYGSDYDYVLS